jgi:hypothetical protein
MQLHQKDTTRAVTNVGHAVSLEETVNAKTWTVE